MNSDEIYKLSSLNHLFSCFQEVLKKSRVIDDKIIYALNQSLPTKSFEGQVDASQTCKDLYSKVSAASYVFFLSISVRNVKGT